MKKIIMIFGILLLSVMLVSADTDHQTEIEEGRKLVESKISCDKLNDKELEAIGDYYMEEMHPGKAHELMHEMMGGHDSELTKEMHINMAKGIYCGESGIMGDGMMNGGMMGGNMMGMMNMMGGNMMGSGMMGSNPLGYGYWSFWNIIWLLFWIGIIVLIIWLIYNFIIKKEEVSETPINILQKRFAKGEISKKQFEEIKKEIGG